MALHPDTAGPAIARLIPIGVAAALVGGLLGGSAPAFVPYTTPDGQPLHWDASTVTYLIAADVPPGTTSDGVTTAAIKALGAWDDLTCLPVELRVDGTRTGLREDADDEQNVVVWVHDEATWTARFSAAELARTGVSYNTSTGVISDVDVLVNAAGYSYSDSESCDGDLYDLQAILTHEFGHGLGLDHSPVEGATMADNVDPGECGLRTLADDDIAGICASYLPTVADPPPDHGGDLDASEGAETTEVADRDGDTGGGCAGGMIPGWPWLLLGLAWRWRRGQDAKRREA